MSDKIGKTPQEDGLYLWIDPSAKGKVIGNKVSDMNVWMHTTWSNPLHEGYMAEVYIPCTRDTWPRYIRSWRRCSS